MLTMRRHLPMDLITVLLFAILARAAHGGMSLVSILDTFWPFALGCVLGAALLTKQKINGADYKGCTIVWLCTITVGLTIWAVRNTAVPHWSFILVATLTSGMLLFGWRVTNSLIATRDQH